MHISGLSYIDEKLKVIQEDIMSHLIEYFEKYQNVLNPFPPRFWTGVTATYTYTSLRNLRGSLLLLSSNQELQNGPNQSSLALLVMELSIFMLYML